MGETRRLAAILAADVVGYSRRMGADEGATLAELRALRAEVFDPLIAAHHGRIVKLMGDGALVEFASVVDAVACAVEVQTAMAACAEGQSDPLQFRIGVNLGDVVVEGEGDAADIYGDGVNVAARLEGAADPGGVCVSRTVVDHAAGKTEAAFEPIGALELKNIAKPVEAYRVRLDGVSAAKAARAWRPKAIFSAAAALVAVALVAGAAWWFARSDKDDLGLPDGPRIAVLPFDNFGEPDKEWFADGLTEDIIAKLSRFHNLQVIARNSTFRYKGAAVDIREIAEDLNAQYVLEGSVRRTVDALRVTAQLIDARDGSHIWSETYDRPLSTSDLFAVQDDVTARVVASIGATDGAIQADRARKTVGVSVPDLQIYDCIMLTSRVSRTGDAKLHAETRDCLRNAVREQPNNAKAWAGLARLIIYEISFGLNLEPEPVRRMLEAAERAGELDPTDPYVIIVIAVANFHAQRREAALTAINRVLEANPHNSSTLGGAALYLVHLGEFARGEKLANKALALDPYPRPSVYHTLFHARYQQGDHEGALASLEAIDRETNNYILFALRAIALVELGRDREAKQQIVRAFEIRADLPRVMRYVRDLWWWALPDKGASYIAALKKAGLDISYGDG